MPTPSKNEQKDKFIGRCIPIELADNPKMEQKQAVAICYSKWKVHTKLVDKLTK